MKNTISIDPSLRSTGIFIKTDKEERLFTIDNNLKSEQDCFCNIDAYIRAIIEKYQIELVLIEDYAYGYKNSTSITPLAEVKGIIKLIAYDLNIDIILIPIQCWKAFSKITEKRKDTKKAQLNYISQAKQFYGRDFKSTDEVDAFLIYFSVRQILNGIIKTDSHKKLYNEYLKIYK